MTKVLFLIEKDLPADFSVQSTDIFAFFPEMNYYSEANMGYGNVTSDNWQDMKTSYSSIGQHSACHPDYANECKEADLNLYFWDLLPELIKQGYNDLVIMNKQEIEYHRQPTELELTVGYGATHYRSFKVSEIGITKQGKLKKWFVADDGLRYYR